MKYKSDFHLYFCCKLKNTIVNKINKIKYKIYIQIKYKIKQEFNILLKGLIVGDDGRDYYCYSSLLLT